MTNQDDAILKGIEAFAYSDDRIVPDSAKWLCQKCRELDAENRGKANKISQILRKLEEVERKKD